MLNISVAESLPKKTFSLDMRQFYFYYTPREEWTLTCLANQTNQDNYDVQDSWLQTLVVPKSEYVVPYDFGLPYAIRYTHHYGEGTHVIPESCEVRFYVKY